MDHSDKSLEGSASENNVDYGGPVQEILEENNY